MRILTKRLQRNYTIVLALGWTLFLAGHGLAASAETQRLYLSGQDKDHAVPWRFQCTSGANSGFWTNLPVPSQWDVQGFGTLNYFKDATNAFNEHGLYEHAFTVPADWTGRRVFLVFEGVMTDTSAKLNGRPVGPVHQGGFYRFKYEVTDQIKFGATNRLDVDVARHSANESVNHAERNADYWVFAGIYRPVYLEAVAPAFIESVAVDARADGGFTANVFLNQAPGDAAVEAQIQTLSGQLVGAPFRAAITAATEKLTLQTHIANPKTWSAETPNLYSVRLQIKRGEEVLHTYHQRFGFRTMEVRAGDGFYINGRRVILKGVNRHSFWPDAGRCLSETVHRLDIATIKDLNGNAVRMSHYPPDAQFLDLCDELGLYVLDELGGWQHSYDTQVGTKLLREMLLRDVNHPCILFWDNGNEGGWNTNLDRLFGQLDPQQRHVLHPWQPFDGINTAHYLPYDRAVIAATGTATSGRVPAKGATGASVPLIYLPTEFLHGLFDGGAGAGLADYWRMMMSHPNCAGGFLWSLLDEAVKRPVTGELDTAGNQAPDGIVGPYRQREGSFYAVKQVWSPITVERLSENTFKLENHYSFTDSRQCSFTWQWRQLPTPGTPGTNFTVLAEASPAAPSIPAGQNGEFTVQLPAAPPTADALALRVADPGGRELWTWVWPTKRVRAQAAQTKPASAQAAAVTAQSDRETIRLQCGDLGVVISKASGRLERVELNGKLISLHNGPRLAVGESVLKTIHLDPSGACAVTATYAGDLQQVRWQLEPDGMLDCHYIYRATGKHNYFGVLFDYPESLVQAKRWLGNGPYRVWKNRLAGGTFNVWANPYNNTITGYREWIYPEFKGCFADVRWLQLITREGTLTVMPEQIPYLQVLTPDMPPEKLLGHAFADLPKCGLGFLDAIPPIGSKFSKAETTGPQGQENLGQGEYSGHVAFRFKN